MKNSLRLRFANACASGRFWLSLVQIGLCLCAGVWFAALARFCAQVWPSFLVGLRESWVLLLCVFAGAVLSWWQTRRRAQLRAALWPLALSGLYLVQGGVYPAWGLALLLAGLIGMVWLCDPHAKFSFEAGCIPWFDLLVFGAALALYMSTLAPDVLPGDSGEFQFVIPTLGIPHPTGYPQYLLLGKLFSLLPLGNMAYRLNLFSALVAAGAVWAVFRAGCALGFGRPAAILTAALLAVSETFWSQATIAEKYALNAFWVAVTLWLGLEWRRTRHAGWLYAWAIAYGLSLTHHRTMVLLFPAYALLFILTEGKQWKKPGRLAGLCFSGLLPLALYGVLPLLSARNPPYAYVRIDSLSAFLDLVLARTYQSGVFRGGWAALPGRVAEFGGLLLRQFGGWGLLLAGLGWFSLWLKRRSLAWVLLLGIVLQIGFALNYYVPNTYVYYLPAYVWLVVCAGAALDFGIQLISSDSSVFSQVNGLSDVSRPSDLLAKAHPLWGEKKEGILRRHLGVLWVCLLFALPVSLGIARQPAMDQKRAYAGLAFDYSYGQMALSSVEPQARIVSDWLPATVLWYMQWVEGLAPTAQVVSLDSLEWQWEGAVAQALVEQRPVYLARPVLGADAYALSSAGPLVRVLDHPRTSPPDMDRRLDLDLTDSIRLLGCDVQVQSSGFRGQMLDGLTVPGGSTVQLTLYWQALFAPIGDEAVTVQVLDPAGNVVRARQNRHPVGGTYPTSRWTPGEVVADYYALDLPADLFSGSYVLRVQMGPPFAPPEQVGQADLFEVAVDKPLQVSAVPPLALREAMGPDLVLIGLDAPREIAAGETVEIAVFWLVRGAPQARPDLVLLSGDGTETRVSSGYAHDADWQPAAQIVERYTLTARSQDRLVLCVADDSFTLPVAVVDAPPPVAQFGGLIRLLEYSYTGWDQQEQATFQAGDEIQLTLEWEAVADIPDPYKVFVHVLGNNGLPIAQQDNEPLNGTYPTTRWSRGERVSDPYRFSLPDGLPPGEYTVEVGLYRQSDFGRLPVLDQDLNVIDDKVFIRSIQIVP